MKTILEQDNISVDDKASSHITWQAIPLKLSFTALLITV
jgi:hypothetical protein